MAYSEGLALILSGKRPILNQGTPHHRKAAMNRGGFSWKSFLGISQAKARISRKIGIPLTSQDGNENWGGDDGLPGTGLGFDNRYGNFGVGQIGVIKTNPGWLMEKICSSLVSGNSM
jgi:hypothetical protein